MREGRPLSDVAVAIAASAGVLLLADLGLSWQSIDVTSGAVSLRVAATGWANGGLLAGFVTIALLVYLTRPLRVGGVTDVPQAAVGGILGLASLGFTVAAAFTGASPVTTSAGAVQVGHHLWPAYAGIGIAAVAAAGALFVLAGVFRGTAAPPPAG